MTRTRLDKRPLALLLALVMVLAMFGLTVPVQAAEDDGQSYSYGYDCIEAEAGQETIYQEVAALSENLGFVAAQTGGVTVYITVENHLTGEFLVPPTRVTSAPSNVLAATREVTGVSGNSTDFGFFVEGIAGLSPAFPEGWIFTVNNSLPGISADRVSLSNNAVIRWQVTGNMGIDLGFRGYIWDPTHPGADEHGMVAQTPDFTPANKSALIRALAAGGGSGDARDAALEVIINPRATSSQVSAALNALGRASNESGSGGGGGGGAGGGTPATGTATPVAPQTAQPAQVTQAAAGAALTTALGQAAQAGASIANVRLQNVGEISLAVMRSMVEAAGTTPIRVSADSLLPGGAVDVRVSFNPALATDGVNLAASTVSPAAQSTRALFERFLDGAVSVVSLSQQGPFGMDVRIAVRVDSALTVDNLTFLVYNREANTFRRFDPGVVTLDANGFLHFSSAMGGEIVITNAQV